MEELVWRGILDSNPWLRTGQVPKERTRPLRRHAFQAIHQALIGAQRGRGVVVLGPRRVGKTVLLHQIAEALLDDGLAPERVPGNGQQRYCPAPWWGSPIKGRSKVYLMAPSLRAALYNLDRDAVRRSDEWGVLVENLVAATAVGGMCRRRNQSRFLAKGQS